MYNTKTFWCFNVPCTDDDDEDDGTWGCLLCTKNTWLCSSIDSFSGTLCLEILVLQQVELVQVMVLHHPQQAHTRGCFTVPRLLH